MTGREAKTDLELTSIRAFLLEKYGIEGTVDPLPGEHDLNYRIRGADGGEFLLKLHADEDVESLDMQVAVLEHLAGTAADLPVSRSLRDRRRAAANPSRHPRPSQGSPPDLAARRIWARADRNAASAETLGRLLGRLDRSLETFSHSGADRIYAWDIGRADMHLPTSTSSTMPEKRAAVRAILEHFVSDVLPRLDTCRRQVIHNDANDYNVLLDADGRVSGLLDFGDMVETWRVIEIAVASCLCADRLARCRSAPSAASPAPTIAVNPISETEADLIFDLVRTRYAVSMCMAAKQIRDNPGEHLSAGQPGGRLARASTTGARKTALSPSPAFAMPAASSPIPHAPDVVRWLENNAHDFAAIIRPTVKQPKVADFRFLRRRLPRPKAGQGLDAAGSREA